MERFVYVDNSNLFIEAKRVSAVRKGMAPNIFEAMNKRILDNSYRYDFGKLYQILVGADSTKKVYLFGSRPPENDSVWAIARSQGFETIIENRNSANKEKKIDTGLAVKMVRDAYKECDSRSDIITLVAGDADFVPAVEQLVNDGFTVEVAFWGHLSGELKNAATKCLNLDTYLDTIMY